MFALKNKQRLLALAFIFIALLLLTTQSNQPFIVLVPMLLFTIVISWYLYKEIQKENEANLQRSIHYLQEEAQAQQWLKKSFVPKARVLAKRELRTIIIASGVLLLSFIFLWSFFVGGLFAAAANTLLGFFFFVGFIFYTLYAPREFTRILRHVPRRYRHHSKNDWVHAYLLLSPFIIAGFFLYSLTTTGEGLIKSLISSIIFFFSYTFLFICAYSMWYLYREYQNEVDEALKKEAKKMIKENHD